MVSVFHIAFMTDNLNQQSYLMIEERKIAS